jgi:RimJ/RimL family protein N-acetyltransferase
VLSWVNSDFVRDAVGTVRPITTAQHWRWYERLQSDQSQLVLIVRDEQAGEPVGVIGLKGIDTTYRNAELWVYLGRPESQRKGMGRQAVCNMLDFAFDTLGLHRVYVHVFDFNEAAHRFFAACGFQDEGLLREAVFKQGRFFDKRVMGVLEREFREHRP